LPALSASIHESAVSDVLFRHPPPVDRGGLKWSVAVTHPIHPAVCDRPSSRIHARASLGARWAALLALSVAAALPAMAQTVGSTLWQNNGGGCMPADATVRSREYLSTSGGGGMRYRNDNSVALLTFVCPVAAMSNVVALDATFLELLFTDPDGPGTNHEVRATLKSFRKDSGVYNANVCRVTSNSAAAGGSFNSTICPLLSTADAGLDNFYYWVEVVLSRSVPSSLTPVFKGIALVEHFTQ
jgi:hypothetical protein